MVFQAGVLGAGAALRGAGGVVTLGNLEGDRGLSNGGRRMSLVAFTPRAEQSLLDILGNAQRLEESLLVVDMHDGTVQLVIKSAGELEELQRDVDLVGPFRVPIAGQETTLFVRESEPAPNGTYELDYCAVGGQPCFQVRPAAD